MRFRLEHENRRRLRFEPLEDRRLLAITVDTLLDENDGVGVGSGTSLREAIGAAASGDTIDFSVTGAIQLTRGPLGINKNLTISGPGASLLTIQANDPTPETKNGDGHRIFFIGDDSGANLLDVSIIGLTLTGADERHDGGGAIWTSENLVVSDCVITNNRCGTGGTEYSGGGAVQSIPVGRLHETLLPNSLTLRNCIFSGNSAPGSEGGAIRKRFGTLLIEDCTITDNFTLFAGGAISAADGGVDVQIHRSTISNNRTTYTGTAFGNGGGVFVVLGSLSVTATTISANSALSGGGIYATPNAAHISIIGSTISGNSAAQGSGIRCGLGLISTSTITANTLLSASPGSAVSSGGVVVSSSIIAGNTNGDVGRGSYLSMGYNLIGTANGTSAFNKPGDQTGVTNPMLGPLADNGGPTMTHEPLPGSLAIDTGNPSFNPADPDGNPNTNDALRFDQRGAPFTRVHGGRIDKGAVERQPIPFAVMGDYNENGIVGAEDYLVWRVNLDTTGVSPYTGADGNGNGMIDQADYDLWRSKFGVSVPLADVAGGASVEKNGLADRRTAIHLLASPASSSQFVAPQAKELRVADVGFLIPDSRELKVVTRGSSAGKHFPSVAVRDDGLMAWLRLLSRRAELDKDQRGGEAGEAALRCAREQALEIAIEDRVAPTAFALRPSAQNRTHRG